MIPISKKFEKNISWIILALFANFEVKRARSAQKIDNLFNKWVLEFNFAFINGAGLLFF
jgi:hypothetical protein